MLAPPDNSSGLLNGMFCASLQPVCRKLVLDRDMVFLQYNYIFDVYMINI